MTSRTPKYRVEYLATSSGARWTPGRWHGHPTNNALAHFIRNMEQSTFPGGTNAHLGATHIYKAQIVEQATGHVVATYGA